MKKLKFLQVHTFYPQPMDDLYRRAPGLVNCGFEEQIDALIADGFSAVHIFPPGLKNLGYDAQLIVANCRQSQQQWLRENPVPLPPNATMHDLVRLQIEHYKPDVLHVADPSTFNGPFIRSLSPKPLLTMVWRAALYHDDLDWVGYDLILSSLTALRKDVVSRGVPYEEHFLPGFPSYIESLVKDITPAYDVIFAGQYNDTIHAGRSKLIRSVAKDSVYGPQPYSCGFYLCAAPDAIPAELAPLNLGSRFGNEMYRALAQGRISIDGQAHIGVVNSQGRMISDLADGETANMRIFESAGCGVFVLTEYKKNLERYFDVGREIETFTGEKELLEKIHYYLAHPEERNAIAQRGRLRCITDHSMANRCKEFDQIIRKYLNKKQGESKTVAGPPTAVQTETNESPGSSVLQDAFTLLNNGENEKALSELNRCAAGLEYARAIALLRMQKTNQAKASLIHSLELDSTHSKAGMLLREIQVQPDTNPDLVRGGSQGRINVNKHDLNEVKELVQQATAAMRANDLRRAFDLLAKAKATRIPLEGVDHARAMIFIQVGHLLEAREAILEELRHFPNNKEAAALRDQIEVKTEPLLHTELGDDQFKMIFRAIRPYTMLHEQRLFNIYSLAKKACIEDVPGNFVECGVAAGGTSAMIAWVIKKFSKRPRKHFSFDTFEGMPEATEKDLSAGGIPADQTGWGAGTCAAPQESLLEIAGKLGVADIITPVKGFFEDTLEKKAPEIGTVAFLHLDADWYESTKTVLSILYDTLHENGYVQFDDYGCWQGCRDAVDEFQATRGISFHLRQIDGNGVWFAKQLVTRNQ